MVKQHKIFLFSSLIILAICFLAHPCSVNAQETMQHVYDDAGLFNAEQIEDLEQLAQKYGNKRDINYLIVTAKDSNSDDIEYFTRELSRIYHEQFMETYGSNYTDCVVLSITIDPFDRYANISAKGILEIKLDDERCTGVFNRIKPELSKQDYYNASISFIKTAHRYIGVKPGIDPENIFLKTWFQLVLALIIAVVAVAIMAYNSGGRMTANANDYLDREHSGVLAHHDHFIRTVTTKTSIPKNNSSGGGSSGGGGGGGSGSNGGGHF